MSSPGDFASTVKQQADIVRIVGEYVKLKRSGAQNYSGLCPFHSEKTGSFSVHATRQFYHCFGCGASGDVFSFVQKIENITFPEAVRSVAQKCGIPLPKVTFSSPEEAREAKLRGALIAIQEKACSWFQEQLRRPEAAHAREYLAGRGLTAEMIEKFRIGYAPDSGFLLRDRLKSEFDEELLKSRETGIYSKSRVLFNLDKAKEAIRKLDYAILVEGQMDCISVYAAGMHNVIASSGTAFTEPQAKLLARFSRKIVVNFDPDTAGAAAGARAAAPRRGGGLWAK